MITVPTPRAEDQRRSVALDDPHWLNLFSRIELDSGNGLFTLLYQKRQGFEAAYRYGRGERLDWQSRSVVWLIVDENRKPIAMDQVVFDFASLIEANEVGVGYEKVRLSKRDLEQIYQAMLEMETEGWYMEYFWDDGRLPVMMVFEE
jgi:nitrogen fixation protein FixH